MLPLWGLPWQAGDELLISDAEHYGVVAALEELARRHQLRITSLAVADLAGDAAATAAAVGQRLEAALTPRTRLVVLSHLLWNTGQLMPIAAVAAQLAGHPRHPWLLVDGAQSLGSLQVAEAAAAADIYACTGHKWCCGPEGLGAVALSARLLADSRPTLIGWRSLDHDGPGAAGYHHDARRFEVATSCTPLYAGLACSLELLEREGGRPGANGGDPGAQRPVVARPPTDCRRPHPAGGAAARRAGELHHGGCRGGAARSSRRRQGAGGAGHLVTHPGISPLRAGLHPPGQHG